MSKIVFFSIPAYGHTNPTIAVVHKLVEMGHEVWYYSFDTFQERIQNAGVKYISCDRYLPEMTPEIESKVGKDFAALIEMVSDMTIHLNDKVCRELKVFDPDCIVSDSVCFWGKLFSMKLQIPYICSTTTFAMNRYTAKLMKQDIKELFCMLKGIPRINKKMKLLREHGFEVKHYISLIENNNDTPTIVYTSKKFQPLSETFSKNYSFVGASIENIQTVQNEREQKVIYISLGTVLNKNLEFYKSCIKALESFDGKVIMSVGENTNIAELGEIPSHIAAEHRVNQIEVLQNTDVFLSHSGMNSVNESLYFGVPLVLFPQHSEEKMVADRVEELGAGVILKDYSEIEIKTDIQEILRNDAYKKNAELLSDGLRNSGGASAAAEAILHIAQSKNERIIPSVK